MAKYNLLLPRMGESVSEATIVKWLKQVGDSIEIDDTLLEIATDKVDSDVPSPVAGRLIEQLFNESEVAQIGDVIAILEVEGEEEEASSNEDVNPIQVPPYVPSPDLTVESPVNKIENHAVADSQPLSSESPVQHERFFSPLVKSIAAEEGVSMTELESLKGSGLEGRVTKDDIVKYVRAKKEGKEPLKVAPLPSETPEVKPVFAESGDEVIEMDRMRKIIADHMLSSVKTSPHVTSFAEADVTNIVNWRNKNKDVFHKREGTKITFTPIFIEAIAKAIRDYPMINVSVNGTQIIKKKNINIGMAAALPSGNLIVPVIKNADQLNLAGISKSVNDLAHRARTNNLKPDEIQGGTFTLTNIGSFGNIMGTPIINQPQVAILAVGSITKKPAVIETEFGDVIAIRHKMYLSLSYDHRVVDGALGGMFLRRITEYLEAWDVNRLV